MSENVNPLDIFPYDPRFVPAVVETAGIFDSPTVCVKINKNWVKHIAAVADRLVWDDAWNGTQEQVDFCVKEVGRWIARLVTQECANLDCDEIEQCIVDRLAIPDSQIAQFTANADFERHGLADGGYPDGTPDFIATMPILTDSTCIDSSIYGFAKGVIEMTHQKALELSGFIVEGGTVIQRIFKILSSVGISKAIPALLLEEFAVWFTEALADLYATEATEAYLQEIACDLFCHLKVAGGCGNESPIEIRTIFDFFWQRLQSTDYHLTLEQTISVMVALEIDDEFVVDALFALIWGLWALGSDLGTDDIVSVKTVLDVLQYQSDEDAETDCGLCNEEENWGQEWDFSVDDGGFYAVDETENGGVFGVYQAGIGWTTSDHNNTAGHRRRMLHIRRDFDPCKVTTLYVNYDAVKGTYNFGSFVNAQTMAILRDSTFARGAIRTVAQFVAGTDIEFNPFGFVEIGINHIAIRMMVCDRNTSAYNGSCLIKAVGIEGIGFNPFEE